jgi:hypothetical protein
VAVTRPTHPTPITPMARSSLISSGMIAARQDARRHPVYFCIDWAMANIWPGLRALSRVLLTQ